MIFSKVDQKSPISANKDFETSKDEDFSFDKGNFLIKNTRPSSAKASEVLKQKRSIAAKHPPINMKKPRVKKFTDLTMIARIKPRRVAIDKERLYEENMALKLRSNKLIEELVKLRTKLIQTEKELNKKEDTGDHLKLTKPVHLINCLKSSIFGCSATLRSRPTITNSGDTRPTTPPSPSTP